MYIRLKLCLVAGFIGFSSFSTALADDFVPEDQEGSNTTVFVLGDGNDSGDVELQFGDTLGERLRWDSANSRFSLSDGLDLENNELSGVRLENAVTAPTCDGAVVGKIYYNTASNDTFTCNGTVWQSLSDSVGVDANQQTLDYDLLPVSTINILSATSVNRPADEVFVVKTLGDNNVKTQVATSGSLKYFRTFQSGAWGTWTAMKTSVYQGYTVQDWDQTDGTASYIGRTRDSDSKWLITLSVPGGFTYAQIENNGGTSDFATAWSNRLTLTYGVNFTP